MPRRLSACAITLLMASPLLAHFVYIVPQAAPRPARVVFSDDLEPDEAVSIAKIAALELFARDGAGKETRFKATQAEHSLDVALPAGTRVVHGSITYGVLQKGDAAPFLLRYHPKSIVGDGLAPVPTVGAERLPVEVFPVGKAGSVRFRVVAGTRPVAQAEVNVLIPGGEKRKVSTDADGLTPTFEATGRYGLWTRHVETTPGMHDGKKYAEVRDYATLVVDIGSR